MVRSSSEAASIPGPHDIERQLLSSGVVVLMRENHASPSVVIDGSLHMGAVDTPAAKAGLARFTASALLRGAGRRSFAQIFEEIESVGASLSFSAGQHVTEFGGHCLAEDVDLLLDILRDALCAPTFPAEQVEKLRGQIITGLQVRAHDTRYVAGREFGKLAYPTEHPYSRSADGTVDTVSALVREDIADFWRQHCGPRGMIVSVVGDVEASEMIGKLEDRLGLGSLPADFAEQSPQEGLPPATALTAIQEHHVHVPGKTQADIALGSAGPPRAAEDYQHARLANTILGVFGLMGRLGDNVRDRQGLAYYSYSELRGGLGPGPWLVRAGVNPANVSQAIDSIRDEIRRLQTEPVPADELADNKSFLVGSLPVHLETNHGVSATILNMELYGLGLDYLQRYPEIIEEVSADQVQAAAQRYLDPEAHALAVAGPQIENE